MPIDLSQVESTYQHLFSLENPTIENALINAMASLGSSVEIDLQTNSSTKSPSFVNQFIIIFLNQYLLSPEYMPSALPSVLKAVARLPTSLEKVLVQYWSSYDKPHLKQILDILNQFITIQLLKDNSENEFPVNDDENIVAATKCMKLVYYASIAGGTFERPLSFMEEKRTEGGLLPASSSQNGEGNNKLLKELNIELSKCRYPLIPYSDFINELLNEKIEMDRDFTNLKYGEPRFAFLNYPFILNTATKSLGLYYDNRVKMYSERRITILLGLMQHSLDALNSPYLRLTVRRDHLIQDALVRVSFSEL